MVTFKDRICAGCGVTYTPNLGRQKCCTRACWKAWYKRENDTSAMHREWSDRVGYNEVVKARKIAHKERLYEQIRLNGGRPATALAAGECYLCGDTLIEGQICMDHDHSYSCRHHPKSYCEICIRGVACHACNVLIGYTKEDPDRLHRIADNLDKTKAHMISLTI